MEYWDLFDGAGQATGETHLRGAKVPTGMFHKVVHIWIQNTKGELLMQKRSDTVDNCPGEWATTGGSVQAGEDELTSSVRELSEELGITVQPSELMHLLTIRRKDAFCYIYLLQKDIAIEALTLQESEVAEAQWMTKETIEKMVTERTMHKYVYWEMLESYLK